MKKIDTTQLTVNETIKLRLLGLDDAEQLFALIDANREYLSRWLAWLDYSISVDDSRDFIRQSVIHAMKGTEYVFGIFYTGVLIGTINILEVQKAVHIGYWLAENYQGKGIVTHCVAYLTHYALQELDANRIVIRCATSNTKSQAIPKKLGFSYEGTARKTEYLNGQWIDLQIYAFVKSDRQ